MKVRIIEAKNYGGAFDVDPESYFTRDDLNEFGYQVEDVLLNTDLKSKDIQFNGVWVDDNILTFAAVDKDGNEVEVKEKIDFRKIKLPTGLSKYYLIKVADKVEKEFRAIYQDYNESLNKNTLKDLQKKHRKTIKKGAQGYFTTLNSGNPEVNMNVFNASANGVSSPVGESLDEALKNTYEVQYLPYRTDNIVTTYIDAYSERQAALILRKTTKGIRRIVSILCIRDRSEEEGEQLELLNEGPSSNHDTLVALIRVAKALGVPVPTFGLPYNKLCFHHINHKHNDNRLKNIAMMSVSQHSSHHASKDRPANTFTEYFEIGNEILNRINQLTSNIQDEKDEN